jgi:hypothetical protein
MTLTDGTTTYTTTQEDIDESPVINSNTSVTIGGKVKSQADSERLKIRSTIRITQSDLATLNNILTNFSETLTYTPTRQLYDRTSIEALTVILSRPPRIRNKAYNGSEIVYHIQMEFEEVLNV